MYVFLLQCNKLMWLGAGRKGRRLVTLQNPASAPSITSSMHSAYHPLVAT